MARIARSLDVLRAQVNARYPNRSKLGDGWIGDAAHQPTQSDHNPNSAGVVTALDITHDPGRGVDTWALAEILRSRKDPRIKYVISNGRIFSSVVSPWQWRPYNGANKHAHHLHISVMGDAALYDLASEWTLDPLRQASTAAPTAVPPRGIIRRHALVHGEGDRRFRGTSRQRQARGLPFAGQRWWRCLRGRRRQRPLSP
jgi:hypothetical protein